MAEIHNDQSGNFSLRFAGDTYNTAVYFARALRTAGNVAYWTLIGNDPLSASFMDAAKCEGIDISHISKIADRKLGIYAVSNDDMGERSFSYWRDGSAATQMFLHDPVECELPKSKIIYLSGITLAILHPSSRKLLIDKLRLLSETGQSLIAFDSNYRPELWESTNAARTCLSEMWDITDIALPSMDDEILLFNDSDIHAVINRFKEKKWRACVIKYGAHGPVSPFIEPQNHPKFKSVEYVVDTTAAGDSFNGAFLAAFLQGQSEIECMNSGHKLASRVISSPGAIISP